MGADLRMELRGYAAATAGVGRAVKRWGEAGLPRNLVRLMDGDGTDQIDQAAYASFTVAAAGAHDFDLLGGGGETDLFGAVLDLAELKLFYATLDTPGDADFLWVGPQNRANTAALWFDGTADAKYKAALYSTMILLNGRAGWAVAGGASKVGFTNPGGDDLAVTLFVAGVRN